MVKRELELWTVKAKYKKKKVDEAMLYDKECPKCKHPEVLGQWNWSKLKYTSFRCSRLECTYHG